MNKTWTGTKSLHVMFDKVDGFIRDYSGTKYVALFGSERCNTICKLLDIYIRLVFHLLFLIIIKKLKLNQNDDLPLEKTLTVHNLSYLLSQF